MTYDFNFQVSNLEHQSPTRHYLESDQACPSVRVFFLVGPSGSRLGAEGPIL